MFNLGNVLYELGSEGGAAERYLQAIDADHNFAEAWNNLGNSLVALGKLEDAVHAYEMALSLEPSYPDAHCNLATVLERMERYEEALVHRAVCQRAYPSPAHLTLIRQAPLGRNRGLTRGRHRNGRAASARLASLRALLPSPAPR